MSLNSLPPSTSLASDSFNKTVNNKVNLTANTAVNFLPASLSVANVVNIFATQSPFVWLKTA
jgi:hypothetical protein